MHARRPPAGTAISFDEGLSYELPYPDKTFDRVLSSLFFHHLSCEDKLRTAREVYRVLRPGGELHVADWGKAANPLMRALFYVIQMLGGFPNTADNVLGHLPEVFRSTGLGDVAVKREFSTVFGTMTLYQADRPV